MIQPVCKCGKPATLWVNPAPHAAATLGSSCTVAMCADCSPLKMTVAPPPVSVPSEGGDVERVYRESYEIAFRQFNDEIKLRLAAEARADALQAENERLKEDVERQGDKIDSQALTIVRLSSLVEALSGALEPFAKACRIVEWTEKATGRVFGTAEPFHGGLAWQTADGTKRTLTYGDLRRARAALALARETRDEPAGRQDTGGANG